MPMVGTTQAAPDSCSKHRLRDEWPEKACFGVIESDGRDEETLADSIPLERQFLYANSDNEE
jgi:hypothetical protein